MPELALMKDDRTLSEWPLDDKEIMIGRGPDCHIVLNDSQVSWHHAKVVKAYGGYLIEDMGSTNGVVIGGRRVTKQMLKFGDRAKIGSHEVCLNRSVDDKYSVPTEKTVSVESSVMSSITAASAPPKTAGRANVRFLTGHESGVSKPIETSLYTIGKAGGGLAIIAKRGDNYILQHLSGKGTTINGIPVSSEGAQLKSGDKIQVGEEQLRFYVE